MTKEKPSFGPTDQYMYWLIPKFTPIAKRARFTPKQSAKMIIRNSMTSLEKDLLIVILYNQKAVITSDFTGMRKVKKQVLLTQKIQIIEHKTCKVSRFQISKTLSFIVIDMLQERLKMGVI